MDQQIMSSQRAMPSSNPQMAAQTYSPNSIHTRQPYKTKINKVCSMCKSDKSPQWRRGPSGDKSLCNACGLRYARSVTRTNSQNLDQTGNTEPAEKKKTQGVQPEQKAYYEALLRNQQITQANHLHQQMLLQNKMMMEAKNIQQISQLPLQSNFDSLVQDTVTHNARLIQMRQEYMQAAQKEYELQQRNLQFALYNLSRTNESGSSNANAQDTPNNLSHLQALHPQAAYNGMRLPNNAQHNLRPLNPYIPPYTKTDYYTPDQRQPQKEE